MNAKYLRGLLVDEVDISDLILAKASLAALDAGYTDAGISSPEWVVDKLNLVSRRIVELNRAELDRQLRAARARRSAIATPDEKRAKLDAQIQELEDKLK